MASVVVLIISGMPAVGKSTAAKALADAFGLRYYCAGDALKELAIQKGYKPSGEDWWETVDGMRFLEERRKNPDFDREVDGRLVQVAKDGNVAITSYTAPWLVNNGIKIWLKASMEVRARRLASRDTMPFERASQIISDRDLENQGIYRNLYGIKFGEDLSVFDFILNTEHLSSENVVEILHTIVKHFT